ncbi:hypothetical protein [Burkholderia pseudomallei]|jgi:hypothetical protein|uniref:hypothetical protein n=1 Tax=Burkholderia pseudomallei TaxID=28450 RepID=UPI0024DF9191|nr:hypothetical protein [Burkholderia pseudomallei]
MIALQFKAEYKVLGVVATQDLEYSFKLYQFWRWRTEKSLMEEIRATLALNGATDIVITQIKKEDKSDA